MDVLIWVVVAGVVIGLAVVAYVLVLRWRGGLTVEEYFHFRCPGCKRRLRFHARQSGHSGECSHCGGKVTFPHASQSCE
jgi:rRNA maturation endonuclease Nob1